MPPAMEPSRRPPRRRLAAAAALAVLAALATLPLLLLGGCISSSLTRVGERLYPPTAASQPIPLYEREADVPFAFEVVGKVRACADSGLVSQARLLERLQDLARELGAEALIVQEPHVVSTGQGSTFEEENGTSELHSVCYLANAIRRVPGAGEPEG